MNKRRWLEAFLIYKLYISLCQMNSISEVTVVAYMIYVIYKLRLPFRYPLIFLHKNDFSITKQWRMI